ncbi:RDD family protein [Polynucleobacter sp. MG-Unter2-18]|uniref:RDD family protein n=1 Tax=Polynucleobacter sp. MG-Unter2-18 TaxID=2081052 RepID=UPI001BFD647A|nr:RDD family protein [Polynucleobacter sp. MG-Unter2-18]QWD95050.1 RDD family protein [Polynucleobacter sp. MG-Unter2-18]
MRFFHQFQYWVVKTKIRNFAAWTAGAIFVFFFFLSSAGTMIKTSENNAEIARINAGIPVEQCAAIVEQCDLRDKEEREFLTANGLGDKYKPFIYSCIEVLKRAAGIAGCTPSEMYSWAQVFQMHFFTPNLLESLLLFWAVPFFTFVALKLLSYERNAGWVRLSVVSALFFSVFSLLYFWDYYSDIELFARWFSISFAGLVVPIAAKTVFFWVKSGFNEGSGSIAPFDLASDTPYNAVKESLLNDNSDLIGQSDQKILPAGSFWDRFFARCIDLPIAVIIVVLISIFIPEFPEHGSLIPLWIFLNAVIRLAILCIVIILWDAFWISRYGATPGKMLFGLTIKDKSGKTPSWGAAKTRAIGFLGQGLHYTIFFPLLQIFGLISSWRRRDEVQPWDRALGTQVLQSSLGVAHRLIVRVIAVVLILSTVLVMQVLMQVYKQEMRNQIVEQYVK